MAIANVKSITYRGNTYKFYPSNLTSETQFVYEAQDATETDGRIYPVRMDANGNLSVNVPWESGNAGLISVEGTITNTSGAYSGTFNDARITSGMKCNLLELGSPGAFGDEISVTANNGSITIACSSVSGSSTFKASFIASAISSTEYDALDNAKADKVSSATDGSFAGLDSNGNLKESCLHMVNGKLYIRYKKEVQS